MEEALSKRRSVRSFKTEALTREQLAQLLWAAQGVTEPARGYRAAPSAGALYPLELYAVTPGGVFKYLPARHAVRKVREGDQRRALSAAALRQSSVAGAPASFVITGVYARTARKYGPRIFSNTVAVQKPDGRIELEIETRAEEGESYASTRTTMVGERGRAPGVRGFPEVGAKRQARLGETE